MTKSGVVMSHKMLRRTKDQGQLDAKIFVLKIHVFEISCVCLEYCLFVFVLAQFQFILSISCCFVFSLGMSHDMKRGGGKQWTSISKGVI